MTNHLPDELKARLIKDMKHGEVGYTVPWAMWADETDRLWINSLYRVESTGDYGTSSMKIQRLGASCVVFRETIPIWSRYYPAARNPNGRLPNHLPVDLRYEYEDREVNGKK